jgi:Fur family ferric uptake transcriptional regulator
MVQNTAVEAPQIRQALRAAGCRMTAPRRAILDAVAARRGHFTATELLDAVQHANPAVERSTVYRTLDLLNQLGLLAATTGDDGVIRFEHRGDTPHHHLACTACGETVEVDDALFEPLRRAMADRYGFRADFEHWMVPGRCSACDVGLGGRAVGRG